MRNKIINFIGESIYEGDIVAYTARSRQSINTRLYVVKNIIDKKVYLQGWKYYSPFSKKVKTYVRRVYYPERLIRVGPHKINTKDPLQKQIFNFYVQYVLPQR